MEWTREVLFDRVFSLHRLTPGYSLREQSRIKSSELIETRNATDRPFACRFDADDYNESTIDSV